MRLYRIDYPKILWGIVLLSLPFAMPRAAEAEPTRKETARQVGLALSQADAPTRQEAVKKQLAAFSELSRLTAREAAMVSVLEKEYKRAYSAYEKAQQALEETEKKKIYASLQSGDEAVMAPLEKEASHREKILTDASVRLALIKRRLEPARSQLAALTARRDGVLDEMAGLVSPKKAPSGVLPPASTDAAILKEGKNLAEAPSVPTETLTDLPRKQAEYAEELADLGYYEEKRAQDLAVLETPEPAVDLSKRFKIDGELRIDNNDTSNHHAVDPERKRIQFPDDRLRQDLHGLQPG